MPAFTALLVQTCHVRRRTAGANNAATGVWQPGSFTTVAASLPCRVSWSAGTEFVGQRGNQRGQLRTARVFFDVSDSYEVQRGDRILVDDVPGVELEVVFQKLVYGSAEPHHWEVDVEIVQGL